MKKYRIEISSVAEAEADKAFLRLSQVASPTKATQWYAGLLKAIESLIQMPKRCLLAREKTTLVKKLDNYSMVKDVIHIAYFSLF